MRKDLPFPLVHRRLILRYARDLLLQPQLVEHALVQRPLGRAALPQLLVVVLQARPVRAELVEAVRADVVQAIGLSAIVLRGWMEGEKAYTLAAHRGTLRPSRMQSTSPRPGASVLHFM